MERMDYRKGVKNEMKQYYSSILLELKADEKMTENIG
jgi:hypothetical protein